ncbi:MAG: hypothetical protein LBG27_04575 [Spirochaetaceae bacterium]|nr:hypothetical protein [Spirochaetaceae bacterium]
MRVIISSCSHKTFYAEYSYNGCKPDVKKAIIKRAAGGAGIRAAARELGASADTVIKEINNPRPEGRSIEYFSLKSLRMRGNKSPTPPDLRTKGRGINPIGIKKREFDRTCEQRIS